MKNYFVVVPSKHHTYSLTDNIGCGVRRNQFFFKFKSNSNDEIARPTLSVESHINLVR